MKELPLNNSPKVALVDDSDFDSVSAFSWCECPRTGTSYARRHVGEGTYQYLHQFILPGLLRVDHKNGDGLDCQRLNLRPATRRQNMHNAVSRRCKYKGVRFAYGKWRARIVIEGREKSLGGFSTEKEAALAYNREAAIHFGEYARLNEV